MKRSVMQLISSGGLYGAERILLELAQHAREEGWDSHVVALESPGAQAVIEEAGERGLKTRIIAYPGIRPAAREIRRYVSDHSIRVAHGHGYKPNVLLAVSQLAPAVARVATCHNWMRDSMKVRLYEWLDRLALRRFDHVVVVSPQLRGRLLESGLSPERVSLIESGVTIQPGDPDQASRLRWDLGLAQGEKLLVRVGRLARIKGNEVLIRALAKVAPQVPVRLVFVGDGEERANLSQEARAQGVEGRVVFAGFRTDVVTFLQAADVCVLSSYEEGLPVVMLEAMAAGVPIVSTAVGAIPTVLRAGDSAWLVPPGDAGALAAALVEALTSPEKARRLAFEAYRLYKERYSRESMGHRYLKMYERVVSQREVTAYPRGTGPKF